MQASALAHAVKCMAESREASNRMRRAKEATIDRLTQDNDRLRRERSAMRDDLAISTGTAPVRLARLFGE